MIAVLTAPGIGAGVPEVRLGGGSPIDLIGTTPVGAGVQVEVDLADPGGWRAVSVDGWDEADRDLLEAVVGQDAVRQLAELRTTLALSGDLRLEADVLVETARSGPWRRLAVIDALDRWLQAPLDQALLDAERAIVRARAARTLRSRSLREHRNGQALVLARRSADDLSTYLTGLASSATSLPRALFSGLSRVANGYAGLASQVIGGPDEGLDAVAEAWGRLKVAVPVVSRRSDGALSPASTTLSSEIDPRQVRARVVEAVRMAESPGGATVRVTVPAFGARVPAALADNLMVRLVDRRLGTTHEAVRLKLKPGNGSPVFIQDVPLRGASVEDVRADVFDPAYETAPALSDNDDALVRQWRAQFVLGEWRRAMVDIRLARQAKSRNSRLTRLAAVLGEAVPDVDEPVFRGGPTRSEITRYVDAAPGTVHPWFTSTRGAGEPLVAELAAAHQLG